MQKEGNPQDKIDLNNLGELPDLKNILSQVPEAQALYDIWYDFTLSTRTPEDSGKRKSRLFKWDEGLTEELRSFFEREAGIYFQAKESRPEYVTWGQLIVRVAEKSANDQAYRIKQAKLQGEQIGGSKGQRLNTRRRKAEIRQQQ